jgi:hypothetical protein
VAQQPSETLYLVAPSGYPNYGDELIVAAWLRYLAEARPDAEVWLDCHNPGQVTHLFNGLHPRLRVTDSMWRLASETAHLPRDEADGVITDRVHHLGTPRFDLGLLALREASTVHFVGGGHVNGMWPSHQGLLTAGAALREVADVGLVATGLGLMPAPEGGTLRNALAVFDHVSVRDAASAELVGVEVAPDDAFLTVRGLPGFGQPAPESPGDVWVCLQHDLAEPEVFDAAVAAVRTALTSPPLEGRTVRYLEAIPGSEPHRLRPALRPHPGGELPAVRAPVAGRVPRASGPDLDHLAIPPPPARRRLRCPGHRAGGRR